MTPQEFIEKWKGDESENWTYSPCALFWARSYKLWFCAKAEELVKDYLGLEIIHRPVAFYRAKEIAEKLNIEYPDNPKME